jgi:GNAT superfamily N-acetyltransferase
MSRVRDILGLVRSGWGRRRLWRAIRVRVYSRRVAFGLRRDVRVRFAAPAAKMPVTIRPLQPDDDLSFLAPVPGLTPEAARGRLDQSRLVAANLPTCWIAADPTGAVCYMQWLIAARDNTRVRARWGGLFPELRKHEALLEGAYTAESHRGQGIMSHVMARIAAQSLRFGAHYVITFVDHQNIASLKGCEKAGFAPYVERRETWFLFRRKVRFLQLPKPTLGPSRQRRTAPLSSRTTFARLATSSRARA